jgi:hypothetical protein
VVLGHGQLRGRTRTTASATSPSATPRRVDGASGRPRALPDARAERTDPRAANESSEPAETDDPIESSEAEEPTEPTDRTEPTEPIERIEPSLAIERIDPRDLQDHRDSTARL